MAEEPGRGDHDYHPQRGRFGAAAPRAEGDGAGTDDAALGDSPGEGPRRLLALRHDGERPHLGGRPCRRRSRPGCPGPGARVSGALGRRCDGWVRGQPEHGAAASSAPGGGRPGARRGGVGAQGTGHDLLVRHGATLVNTGNIVIYVYATPDYEDPTGARGLVCRGIENCIWVKPGASVFTTSR